MKTEQQILAKIKRHEKAWEQSGLAGNYAGASDFNVHNMSIRRILKGETWAHVK